MIRAKMKGPLKGKAAAFDTQFSLFQLHGVGRIVPQWELRKPCPAKAPLSISIWISRVDSLEDRHGGRRDYEIVYSHRQGN